MEIITLNNNLTSHNFKTAMPKGIVFYTRLVWDADSGGNL